MTLKDGTVILDPVALVRKFVAMRKPKTQECRHAGRMRKHRARNLAAGLTAEGKPRRNRQINLKSMSHADYLRYKRESRYWRKALASLWEQAANGVFGPLEARQNRF